MHPRIKLVSELYLITEKLVLKALKQMKPEVIDSRPIEKANSFRWVFGHITAHRYMLAKAIGLNENVEWEKLYSFGAPLQESSAYPSIDEITKAFSHISEKIRQRFPALTEDDLAGEAAFEIPGLEKTTAGTIAFLSLHESYHVGQLAYIMRLHDCDKLVG
ncbi:MAG: DinB family protein [Candidatus Zixiibacteriota bacterium]